ncbi:MAG: DUF1273 family protein [Ruminiclostridium sp.]|nr:DUF1273 family protein [Ruminiclostridium sp.]
MRSVCFTGHRSIDSADRLYIKALLKETICNLAKRGATDFYCGGALGWDTEAASMVLRLKEEKGLDISLHLILPCRNEEQTKKWSDEDKHTFYTILMHAETVEYVGSDYTKACMKNRNARLIELADCCVCYYDSSNFRSGTGQTVRMAEDKGIEIINIYELVNTTPDF